MVKVVPTLIFVGFTVKEFILIPWLPPPPPPPPTGKPMSPPPPPPPQEKAKSARAESPAKVAFFISTPP